MKVERKPQSHVVGLHRVGFAFETEHELVELKAVGHDPVRRRRIGICGGAEVSRGGRPAVDFDAVVLEPVAAQGWRKDPCMQRIAIEGGVLGTPMSG